MNAIASMFGGIQYRSRLEARWAAFMHNIGWEHTYEPIDGDGYIPDFLVHGANPFFVEVKPAATKREFVVEQEKVEKGVRGLGRDIVIVGMTAFNGPEVGRGFYGDDNVAGYLCQEGVWGTANWRTCLKCHRVALVHTTMGFHTYPCDHYEGKAYAGEPAMEYLQGAWSDACNEVRWKGRAA